MFVADTGGELFFLSGPYLIKIPRREFARSVYLDAIGRGVATAAWVEPVGKVGFAFLVPFVGGLLGTVGVVAALATFAVKMGLFYAAHQTNVHKALAQLPTVLAAIRYINTNCPTLASFLSKAGKTNAWNAALKGAGAEEAADLLGRLLGGISAAPSLGFKALALIALKALAVSAALRGPGAIARGSREQAVQELKRLLREGGADIQQEEAESIFDEGCLEKAATVENLQKLEQGLRALEPLLQRMAQSLTVVE